MAPAIPCRSVLFFHLLHIQKASRSWPPAGFAHRATKDIIWVRRSAPLSLYAASHSMPTLTLCHLSLYAASPSPCPRRKTM